MRVELAKVKAELEAAKKPVVKEEPKPKVEPDKVPEELVKIRSELDEIKAERNNAVAFNQLSTLSTNYGLKPDDLIEFAEKAEQAGYVLMNDPSKIVTIYQTLYAEKIIADEVGKRLQEELKKINPDIKTPSSGPKGKTIVKNDKSIAGIIDAIGEKYNK